MQSERLAIWSEACAFCNRLQGRKHAEHMFQWGRSFTELVGHYNEAIDLHRTNPRRPSSLSATAGSFLRRRMQR
eukprot:1911954-Pyramimonas_sp.AAC.1